MLDDTYIIYVVRVPTRRIMTISLAVGTRLPAYATSMGRVLLAQLDDDELTDRLARIKPKRLTAYTIRSKPALRAELERVREQGYALVDQELEEGVRSAAVPIRSTDGQFAALNISVHASRATFEDLREKFLPPLRETAIAIERDSRGDSVSG
jgi:IclR family pca regulon transcriptional regulator